MKLGLIQMATGEDVNYNLERIKKWVEDAKFLNCDLLALPEVFNCFTHDLLKIELAEPINNSRSLQFCQKLAEENQIHIMAGSMNLLLEKQNKVVNRSHLIDPNGKILCSYDKIHLFDVTLSDGREYSESKLTQPGEEVIDCKTRLAHFGFSICYDLRFPELYRELSKRGCEVLFVPSAFTRKTGKDHWKLLLRARAVENQAFVIAPNQCGVHERGMETYGHSLVIDPWGEVLLECPSAEEGLYCCELDLASITELKSRMPVLSHRRLA